MTMFGAFRGKLFSAGYWSNVAASWSSYLMRLEKDGSPMFEVDEDGNVECAGDVTANGVLLGAGGAGTPGGADTEIQFNDSSAFAGDSALTWNKTTQTLAAPILDLSDKVVTPALKVTGGTPGAGKVLVSDADGDATWATPKRTITITITPYGTIGTGGYYWGGKQELGAVNGFIMPTGFQPTRIELIARNDGANGVDQQLSAIIGQISDAAYTEYDTLTLASTALYEYKAERRTYDGVSGPGPWLTGRRLAVFIRRVTGNAAWEQVSLVITAEADA